jgi:hypothetical protein
MVADMQPRADPQREPAPAARVRVPRRGGGTLCIVAAGLFLSGCAIGLAPSPTSAQAYLRQAQSAIAARDAGTALAALDRAESIWSAGNAQYRNPFTSSAPDVLRQMGQARTAVQMQRWNDAARLIDAAARDPSTLRG